MTIADDSRLPMGLFNGSDNDPEPAGRAIAPIFDTIVPHPGPDASHSRGEPAPDGPIRQPRVPGVRKFVAGFDPGPGGS